jgi:predicted acyltransferase (DUF342 family)
MSSKKKRRLRQLIGSRKITTEATLHNPGTIRHCMTPVMPATTTAIMAIIPARTKTADGRVIMKEEGDQKMIITLDMIAEEVMKDMTADQHSLKDEKVQGDSHLSITHNVLVQTNGRIVNMTHLGEKIAINDDLVQKIAMNSILPYCSVQGECQVSAPDPIIVYMMVQSMLTKRILTLSMLMVQLLAK